MEGDTDVALPTHSVWGTGVDLKDRHGFDNYNNSSILFTIFTIDYTNMSLILKVNYILCVFQKMSANSRNSNI